MVRDVLRRLGALCYLTSVDGRGYDEYAIRRAYAYSALNRWVRVIVTFPLSPSVL